MITIAAMDQPPRTVRDTLPGGLGIEPGAAENESIVRSNCLPAPGRVLVAERQCISRRSRINVGAIRVQGLGESVRSEELDAVA